MQADETRSEAGSGLGVALEAAVVPENRRVIVIDDNADIHVDFRKVLGESESLGGEDLDDLEADLFGEEASQRPARRPVYSIDCALQGQEGLEMVEAAIEQGEPYAMAFVDIRMPPGWDGIETIEHLWRSQPNLEVVICSAYSDYTWDDMIGRLGYSDKLLMLKKPFEHVEVMQVAAALTEKWRLARGAEQREQQMETLVRERTAELEDRSERLKRTLHELSDAQAHLLQSEKLASIGQLAAGVAHEINNPIGFVSSNLRSLSTSIESVWQVLRADALAIESPADSVAVAGAVKARDEVGLDALVQDVDEILEECDDGIRRITKIVSDLRDFSHADNSEQTRENVNDLVDKAVAIASNELKYKADIQREYGDLPTIDCCAGNLVQVFLNLLINAAQAIEEQGAITIRTQVDGDDVIVAVQDNGPGIDPEVMAKIFDPFFTTKDVGQGTGLGLHISRNVVEAHGGVITVESAPGEGAVFTVRVPVCGVDAVTEFFEMG